MWRSLTVLTASIRPLLRETKKRVVLGLRVECDRTKFFTATTPASVLVSDGQSEKCSISDPPI